MNYHNILGNVMERSRWVRMGKEISRPRDYNFTG